MTSAAQCPKVGGRNEAARGAYQDETTDWKRQTSVDLVISAPTGSRAPKREDGSEGLW
jgi:hypothetical protein